MYYYLEEITSNDWYTIYEGEEFAELLRKADREIYLSKFYKTQNFYLFIFQNVEEFRLWEDDPTDEHIIKDAKQYDIFYNFIDIVAEEQKKND